MLPSTSAKHLLATLATALGCAWERDRCWPPRLRRRGLRRLHQMSAELHSLRTACFYNLMDTRCSIAGTDASSLGFIGKQNNEKERTHHNTASAMDTPPQNTAEQTLANRCINQRAYVRHAEHLEGHKSKHHSTKQNTAIQNMPKQPKLNQCIKTASSSASHKSLQSMAEQSKHWKTHV